MNKITLERQTSHRYNAAYSYLNDSEYVGTARLLTRKEKRGDDESRKVFSLVLVSSKESQEHVIQGIRDTMRSACRCEHDCCGHWQSYVGKVRPLKNNLYAVIEYGNRNI